MDDKKNIVDLIADSVYNVCRQHFASDAVVEAKEPPDAEPEVAVLCREIAKAALAVIFTEGYRKKKEGKQ